MTVTEYRSALRWLSDAIEEPAGRDAIGVRLRDALGTLDGVDVTRPDSVRVSIAIDLRFGPMPGERP